MSKFVNFNKRGIELPPGCKDLIDVLQPAQRKSILLDAERKLTRDDVTQMKISELRHPIQQLAATKAWMCQVVVSSLDERLGFILYGASDEAVAARVWIGETDSRESLLRQFFLRHHLEAPPDAKESVAPVSFIPNMPVQLIYPVAPLPSNPGAVTNLITRMLCEVGQLELTADVKVRYMEVN